MIETFFSLIFSNPFLQAALIAAGLSSISTGIMGSFVVIKKIHFITGSISHSIFGGIGLFAYLQYYYNYSWADPLWGAFFAAIVSAILIGFVHLHFQEKEDSIIATIWCIGMSIGIVFLTKIPGNTSYFTHFLFGNILWVTNHDLIALGLLDIGIIGITLLYYSKFLLLCFDEELARLQKVSIKSLYFLLLSFIALSVVLLIQIIGIILVIALLTIPPTISLLFSKRLPMVMLVSMVLCFCFNILGIGGAYILNWPPGATIALICAVFYAFALIIKSSFPLLKNLFLK